MQANNCMFKHPFDAKDRSRVRLRNTNRTESSDSVKKKNIARSNCRNLRSQAMVKRYMIYPWFSSRLIIKTQDWMWMLAYTFESSAVLSCSGGSGSYFKVLGSHPDLKTRQSEGDDMLEQQPFGKKGRYEFSKSLSVQTRPNEWALSTITVQALPLQLQFHRKKRNKIFVVAVAWSSLCFDWYASC